MLGHDDHHGLVDHGDHRPEQNQPKESRETHADPPDPTPLVEPPQEQSDDDKNKREPHGGILGLIKRRTPRRMPSGLE